MISQSQNSYSIGKKDKAVLKGNMEEHGKQYVQKGKEKTKRNWQSQNMYNIMHWQSECPDAITISVQEWKPGGKCQQASKN